MSTRLQATWEQAELVDALEALRVGGDDLQAMRCCTLDESEAKGALRDGKTSVSKYASSKLFVVHRPCAARLTTGASLEFVDASTQRDELPSVP